MDALRKSMLEGWHVYLVASGAATHIQHKLWMIPGTSSFLVGASFPYATDDTDEFLGFKPEKYCSREESLQLAMESFIRARRHGLAGGNKGKPMGVGITASVASAVGPAHRGEHRVHVSVVTENGYWHKSKVLEKGSGIVQRASDNNVCGLVVEDVMMVALGTTGSRPDVNLVPEAEVRGIFFKHPFFSETGRRAPNEKGIYSFFPGSFNPLHDGHRQVAIDAAGSSESPVTYMVCLDSVHKPPLSIAEALSRAAQFRLERLAGRPGNVLFTQGDPLFVDKFSTYPGRTFLLGADTFIRMMDPVWGASAADVIKSIDDNDIMVWIYDRTTKGVKTKGYEHLKRLVPKEFHRNFYSVDCVTVDISSTELREGG